MSMLMRLDELRKYVAWTGRTDAEKRVIEVAKGKAQIYMLGGQGFERVSCMQGYFDECVYWTDYELQPEDVVPAGRRLVTDEDRKYPKPKCAEMWVLPTKEWILSRSDNWSPSVTYTLPADYKHEPERNDDGDTLEDFEAVQEAHGGKAIEILVDGSWRHNLTRYHFGSPVSDYRIRAKHSDKFCPDCMDRATWRRAVIDRGMVVKRTFSAEYGGGIVYGVSIKDNYLMDSNNNGLATLNSSLAKEEIAITQAQYRQETQPSKPKVKLFDRKVNKLPAIDDTVDGYRIVGYTDNANWKYTNSSRITPCYVSADGKLVKHKYAIGILDSEVQDERSK